MFVQVEFDIACKDESSGEDVAGEKNECPNLDFHYRILSKDGDSDNWTVRITSQVHNPCG